MDYKSKIDLRSYVLKNSKFCLNQGGTIMKTKNSIAIFMIIGILSIYCDKNSSSPEKNEITVTGDYETTFNYVLPVQNTETKDYYGALATQSLNFFEDEFGFGLYDDYGIFTKKIGDWEWIGYTANNLDASYDLSDTLKPKISVSNIVLYYDSSYVSFGIWEFTGEGLDSSRYVILDGEMITYLSAFTIK